MIQLTVTSSNKEVSQIGNYSFSHLQLTKQQKNLTNDIMKLLQLDVSSYIKAVNGQKQRQEKLNAELKETLHSILHICDEKIPVSKKLETILELTKNRKTLER